MRFSYSPPRLGVPFVRNAQAREALDEPERGGAWWSDGGDYCGFALMDSTFLQCGQL